MELIYPEVFLTESEAPTQLSVLILCKVRAISKSDKHHIHLDMYLGQIGYRILDMVPSSVNRALKFGLLLNLYMRCTTSRAGQIRWRWYSRLLPDTARRATPDCPATRT